MNNKGVGAIFCLIAAVLMAAKYIAVGLFMSNVNTWSAEMFSEGLSYVGSLPTILAAIAFGVGVFFLVLGLAKDK